MISTEQARVRFDVIYGLGGMCGTSVPRAEINGQTARQMIRIVTDSTQSDPNAARTAREITRALGGPFELDVEFIGRSVGPGGADGEPVGIDEPLFPGPESPSHRPVPNHVTLRLSESYRGG